jgi:hypothetical protein
VQRLNISSLLTALLIGLAPVGGALAQQDPWLPRAGDALVPDASRPYVPGAIRQLATRFDVIGAPAHFDQVVQIVDFPAGTWTPLHTPGGHIYNTVIDGAISTRLPATGRVSEPALANRLCDESADVRWRMLAGMEAAAIYASLEPATPASCEQGVHQTETTYRAGDTFVQKPGEFIQVGNASTGNTRILTTAVLPSGAPLTIYQDGFTSSDFPSLANWNYTHDIVFSAPGPETVHRSVTGIDRPEGTSELVQLVLDLTALQPLSNIIGNEVREGCASAWVRLAGDTLIVYPRVFEHVATNLCVSSDYAPIHVAPNPSYGSVSALDDFDLQRAGHPD